MSSYLRLTVISLASFVLTCNAAMAAGVGAGKSFHGPTGLQLYSLRDLQKAEGMAAMLDKAQSLGFKYVEVAGTGDMSLAEFKKQLDQRGLVPISSLLAYERFRDDVESVAKDAEALGIQYVGCASIP